MILGAEDVGEDRVLRPFLDETHRDACDCAADRNAGVEQREGSAAHRSHRRRAVRLENIGHDANRVRELLERRQHALQRALGKIAVTDFAPARAAHRAHFSRGERREVVVQHERLRRLARFIDGVETLHVVRGSERHRDQRLRLAAREQRGAVRARQNPGLDRDRPHFVRPATIDALARLEDLRAQTVILDVADQRLRCPWRFRELREQRARRSPSSRARPPRCACACLSG